MPSAWQPLYVTEVRAAMATIGLAPVGSATLIENFDRLALSDSARETLAPSPMRICVSWSATFTWISACAAMFSPAATTDWRRARCDALWRAPLRSLAPLPQYATRPPPRRAFTPTTARRHGQRSARSPTALDPSPTSPRFWHLRRIWQPTSPYCARSGTLFRSSPYALLSNRSIARFFGSSTDQKRSAGRPAQRYRPRRRSWSDAPAARR